MTYGLRRLLPVTLLLTAPALCVLLVLALTGHLLGWVAVAAAAAVLVGTAVALFAAMRDLARLRTRILGLSGAGDADDGDLRLGREQSGEGGGWSYPFGDLAATVAAQRQHIAEMLATLEARVAAAEAIIDGVPEPLLLVDQRHRVAQANLAAGNLLGKELAGRDLGMILRAPPVIACLSDVLADGRVRAVDFTLAQPIALELRARVARLPRGEIVPRSETGQRSEAGFAAVVALEDLTAIRRAEEMRVDFVANVSHELKTPVATMLGFIETLQGPARDDREASDRFLGIMSDQARRMERLVEDLLSLSRIELDEHIVPRGRADLAEILQADTDALEIVAGRRGMRIELDLSETLPPVAGDSGQIAQVFRNLIENALKYGREGTEVKIVARVEGGMVRTSVIDQGEGIPRHHIPRLTERFYRVDPARSRAAGGTGLGLAIVKHIVNRHRGTLMIESEVGKGSRFTVRLPIARSSATRHGSETKM